VLFPLAVFLLVAARPVIVALFTTRYVASVPIFVVWTLTILPAAFAVDGVLRVYAQTRFLLVMNAIRLALVAGGIWWFMGVFGLSGAVLVTLFATSLVKVFGILKIGRVLHIPARQLLPWDRLSVIVLASVIAAAPVYWINHALSLPPLALL